MSSNAWNHFSKDEEQDNKAKCKYCPDLLFIVKGSTFGLFKHLLAKHPNVDLKNNTNGVEDSQVCFLETPECIVVRLICEDNISLNKICKSKTLRKICLKSNIELPKSRSTLKQYIENCYNIVFGIIKSEIAEKVFNGSKYYLTIDEWTSSSNRRYINVNVHFACGKFYCLGFIRIKGSATATNLLTYIQEKLQLYDISMNDHVLSITSDGASVMKNWVKIQE